jgi:N-acetylglucosamine repressor
MSLSSNRRTMGTQPGVMRELNRNLVLDLVKNEGPLSRVDLAKRSMLAKPTVSAIVEDLISNDVLQETGVGATGRTGGRRPILVAFNARSQFAVGVHIGVQATTAILADGLGRAVARAEAKTPRRDADAALQVVHDLVKILVRGSRVGQKRIVGAGISVPGLVDPESGVCFLAPNLGWRDETDVREPLQRLLGYPVFVHNVVQSIAVAEQREGAARDAQTVAVLYEDNGIGAALMHNGAVFHGTGGIAGELGHVKLPGETRPCHCGGRGCLETVASAPAVARRAAELPGLAVERVSATRSSFATLAANQDPKVQALLAQVGAELGIAASWLLNLYNPEILVLAGGFLEAGDVLLESLRRIALESALPRAGEAVEIRTSLLGSGAPARGAVLLALQASDRSYRLAFGLGESRV